MATEPTVLRESLFVLQASWRRANVVEKHSWRTVASSPIIHRELGTQLPKKDSFLETMNLGEGFTPKQCFSENSYEQKLDNRGLSGSHSLRF